MINKLKRYLTGTVVRLSASEAAGLRLPPASIGVIGIGPVAVLFNLPKALVKPDRPPVEVISIDEINRRARMNNVGK